MSVTYFRALLGVHAARLRQARQAGERGASAIELAIITGVLVVLAIGVLTLIIVEVKKGQKHITNTIPN